MDFGDEDKDDEEEKKEEETITKVTSSVAPTVNETLPNMLADDQIVDDLRQLSSDLVKQLRAQLSPTKADTHYASDKAAPRHTTDSELEAAAAGWIAAITGATRDADAAFGEWLRDGTVLCDLANKIRSGVVRRINRSAMPFKQMENIAAFLRACRALGCEEHEVFETVDLFEQKDVGLVVRTIFALGAAAQAENNPALRATLGVPRRVSKDPPRSDRFRAAALSGTVSLLNQAPCHLVVRRSTLNNYCTSNCQMLDQGSARTMARTHISMFGRIGVDRRQMGACRAAAAPAASAAAADAPAASAAARDASMRSAELATLRETASRARDAADAADTRARAAEATQEQRVRDAAAAHDAERASAAAAHAEALGAIEARIREASRPS